MAIQTVHFITGNKEKLREVKAILDGVIEVQQTSADLPELQGSIEWIAQEKCARAAELVRHSSQLMRMLY